VLPGTGLPAIETDACTGWLGGGASRSYEIAYCEAGAPGLPSTPRKKSPWAPAATEWVNVPAAEDWATDTPALLYRRSVGRLVPPKPAPLYQAPRVTVKA
jgi:hypothetical protein